MLLDKGENTTPACYSLSFQGLMKSNKEELKEGRGRVLKMG